MNASREDYFARLVELMDILRGPQGCPWDKEQTRETLKPMLIEEAYEALEALDRTNPDELCEELGDLLFQVVFHSRISQENGEFDAYEVCRRLYEKMVGRHPHVFGGTSYASAQELLKHWEDIKAAEKEASGAAVKKRASLLDGIPEHLPALYTTYQITSKASRVGFDWSDVEGIRDKFLEEFEELKAVFQNGDPEHIKDEVGDLLFTAVNIARFLQIDPETALKRANHKFAARFKEMEKHFAEQGKPLREVSLKEMDEFWERAKGEVYP